MPNLLRSYTYLGNCLCRRAPHGARRMGRVPPPNLPYPVALSTEAGTKILLGVATAPCNCFLEREQRKCERTHH
jgi:hypothetical protein